MSYHNLSFEVSLIWTAGIIHVFHNLGMSTTTFTWLWEKEWETVWEMYTFNLKLSANMNLSRELESFFFISVTTQYFLILFIEWYYTLKFIQSLRMILNSYIMFLLNLQTDSVRRYKTSICKVLYEFSVCTWLLGPIRFYSKQNMSRNEIKFLYAK